ALMVRTPSKGRQRAPGAPAGSARMAGIGRPAPRRPGLLRCSEIRMSRPPVNPARVDWSGENPGMYLKEREDGPFSALISFFRVVHSPHGRGHAVIFITDPDRPVQGAGHVNAVYTDNPDLARYLVDEFARHFGSFRPVPGLAELPIKRAWNFRASGDPRSRYIELAETEDGPLSLTWSE